MSYEINVITHKENGGRTVMSRINDLMQREGFPNTSLLPCMYNYIFTHVHVDL